MTDPKKLILNLTKEFSKNPLIKAFVLVGSQARKDTYKASKHSDIEAYLVVEDQYAEKLEKELPKVVKKFGKVLFYFKHQIGFVAVYEDLLRIELPIVKISEIENVFSRPKAQVVEVIIDRTK